MKEYEIMFVLDDRKLEDGGKGFAEQTRTFIDELGGHVKDEKLVGRQQLAYLLNRRHTGFFFNLLATLPPNQVAAFHEHYRLDNAVHRLQVYIHEPLDDGAKLSRFGRRRRSGPRR